MNEKILLAHGSGGKLTSRLIQEVFRKSYDNPQLATESDSALLRYGAEDIAFTTDSYVVDPIFFPGGNIGKLAVCGTVNDLAVCGANPLYLSAGFIIEEGFPVEDLREISQSMAMAAEEAGVSIVTGDTKVVDKGKCDKIFINTAGIGKIPKQYLHLAGGEHICPGDVVLINGNIAEHGIAVMAARDDIKFESDVVSDCAPLNSMINHMLEEGIGIKFMRDATRGGVATVLCEIVKNRNFGLQLQEDAVPVSENVNGLCEILGFDTLYVANEGKVVIIVDKKDAMKAVEIMQRNKYGKSAAVIGSVTDSNTGRAVLQTGIGGRRILDMLTGQQLPRIC